MKIIHLLFILISATTSLVAMQENKVLQEIKTPQDLVTSIKTHLAQSDGLYGIKDMKEILVVGLVEEWLKRREVRITMGFDHEGRTALHHAVLNNETKVVRILLKLLDAPSLIFARDCNGATALHYASEKGSNKIAALILDYARYLDLAKQLLDVIDYNGHTAFDVAMGVKGGLTYQLLEGYTYSPMYYQVLRERLMHEAEMWTSYGFLI